MERERKIFFGGKNFFWPRANRSTVIRHRNLMGERNFPPLRSRLQNRETNFQCGLAPSAIVEDRPIIHNAFIELLQLSFSGVYPLRHMYFSLTVFVVHVKTVRR